MPARVKLLGTALVVTCVAALWLQRTGPPPELDLAGAIAGLRAGDDLDRAHASLVLAHMEPPPAAAVAPLLVALDDDDYAVRSNASRALRRIGAPAVPGLIALLPRGGVLGDMAAETLGAMGPLAAPAVPALGAATRAGKGAPVHAAMEALKGQGEPGLKELVKTLDRGTGLDPWYEDRVVAAVASFGARAVPHVIAQLDGAATARSNHALSVLSAVGEPAAPALLAALATGDVRRQEAAVYALWNAKVRTPAVLAALHHLAATTDERLRDTVSRALRDLDPAQRR